MRYRNFEFLVEIIPPVPDGLSRQFIARTSMLTKHLPDQRVQRIWMSFTAIGASEEEANDRLLEQIHRFVDAHP